MDIIEQLRREYERVEDTERDGSGNYIPVDVRRDRCRWIQKQIDFNLEVANG